MAPILHHPQASAGTEQCCKDCSSSAKAIIHTAAEGTALVAGEAVHLLQAGRADVQDTAYVSTGVSQSAHLGMQQTWSLRSPAVLFRERPIQDL